MGDSISLLNSGWSGWAAAGALGEAADRHCSVVRRRLELGRLDHRCRAHLARGGDIDSSAVRLTEKGGEKRFLAAEKAGRNFLMDQKYQLANLNNKKRSLRVLDQ